MSPTEWNIYTAALSGLAGILAANTFGLIRQNKRIEIARKFAFEEGANLTSTDVSRRQAEAWTHGFNSGVGLARLDEAMEDFEWEREERWAQLEEESKNWDPELKVFYPLEGRRF